MSHRGSPSLASENRRRVVLFVGLSAVLLAGVAITGVLLLRRASPGPRDAVEAWLAAAKAGDIERLRVMTCAARVDEVATLDPEQATSLAWAVGEETTADTTTDATVRVTADVTYTVEGYLQHDSWTFDLVREGGDWRYCGRAADLSEPDTPRTAVADWLAAARAGDLATVQAATCSRRAGEITADEVGTGERQTLTYEITDVRRVDETTARVAFTVLVQRNGGPVSFDEQWLLVDEDGAWKVCGPA